MRPRFVISLLALLVVSSAIVFWLRSKHGATQPTPISEIIQATNQPVLTNTNFVSQNTSPAPLPRNPPENQHAVVTHKAETPEQAKQEIESANGPIEFYGKVIDQNSNALSGVRVKLGVRHSVYLIPNSLEAIKYATLSQEELQKTLNPTTVVITDNNGRFQWTDSNVTGDIMGVGSLTKDGYESEPGQYSCGAGSGNFDNPVIFKMWSTNIHEKLITGERKFKIAPDGRPYFINLMDGTISESGTGDLKVWVKRPEPITSRRYDWSCGVEAINGEILLEDDKNAAMYEAPASGYTNSFSYEEGAVANGWGDTTGEQRFYVRLNNGQEYGRISIELEAYYNSQIPGMIRLSYAINPSGSRVLR